MSVKSGHFFLPNKTEILSVVWEENILYPKTCLKGTSLVRIWSTHCRPSFGSVLPGQHHALPKYKRTRHQPYYINTAYLKFKHNCDKCIIFLKIFCFPVERSVHEKELLPDGWRTRNYSKTYSEIINGKVIDSQSPNPSLHPADICPPSS